MSTATPTAEDEATARLGRRCPRFVQLLQECMVDGALRAAQPHYSARDRQRVARILAPFTLRDRYADH